MNVRRRGVGYQEGGYQNQLSAKKGAGGSKFLSFWDNVMIDCPLTRMCLIVERGIIK